MLTLGGQSYETWDGLKEYYALYTDIGAYTSLFVGVLLVFEIDSPLFIFRYLRVPAEVLYPGKAHSRRCSLWGSAIFGAMQWHVVLHDDYPRYPASCMGHVAALPLEKIQNAPFSDL